MTPTEEQEMHALAVQLEQLTRGTGWEAMRYMAIGRTMNKLVEYCAVDPPHVHHWVPYDPEFSVGDESDYNWRCAAAGCGKLKR